MLVVPIVAASLFALFALAGRWIQLHPERMVPKGQFVGPNTRGARFFRAQMAILGTFVVFGGTTAAVFSLLSLLRSTSVRLVFSRPFMSVGRLEPDLSMSATLPAVGGRRRHNYTHNPAPCVLSEMGIFRQLTCQDILGHHEYLSI
jgi:hypothetical protein